MGERLCLITDRKQARGGDVVAQVSAALSVLPAGFALVQLRDKELTTRELQGLAQALRDVTRAAGARLVVNDRIDLALAIGADGVHLPESGLSVADARRLLGPSRLVGASVHGIDSAREKADAGADYVLVGPVWATPSKAAYGPPLGLGTLRIVARAVQPSCKVFAVGGITDETRAREAVREGAHGIAVIRGIMSAAAAGPAATAFQKAIST